MIEVRHLRKDFEDSSPLMDLNCVINDGDIVAIIGPSGCGKSTLLRCMNLLETPTSGEILFDGKDILKGELSPVEVRKYAGMVFQGYYLYPQYNVLENIMVPQVDILKRSKQEAYDRAIENLKMVDLINAAKKMPDQLSGGQKQRVAIARTLAMDNEVLLMDEPTSALDPVMVREVEYVMKKLAKAGKTMVIVTHEMRLAREFAKRVFFLTDGILYEEGSPEQIFENPQKEKTQNFINCVNEKSIEMTKKTFEFITCVTAIGEFAERNDMSHVSQQRIERLFEEVVAVSLLPVLNEDDYINIKIYYSEMTGRAFLEIYFPWHKTEFFEQKDEISQKLIKHNSEECTFVPPDQNGEAKIVVEVKM